MHNITLFILSAVFDVVHGDGQYYVPRAYYTIDAEGHESARVPVHRLLLHPLPSLSSPPTKFSPRPNPRSDPGSNPEVNPAPKPKPKPNRGPNLGSSPQRNSVPHRRPNMGLNQIHPNPRLNPIQLKPRSYIIQPYPRSYLRQSYPWSYPRPYPRPYPIQRTWAPTLSSLTPRRMGLTQTPTLILKHTEVVLRQRTQLSSGIIKGGWGGNEGAGGNWGNNRPS